MPHRESVLAELASLGIHPRKGLGQNFLVDTGYQAAIVGAAELTPYDTVLEVGPGPGVLTDLLADQAGRVVAVELDDRLIPYLQRRYAGRPHVTIVHADILETDIGTLMTSLSAVRPVLKSGALPVESSHLSGDAYSVVANLPYYITGAAVRHLLDAQPAPTHLVLTVQWEVARRMTAVPPEMSLLALGVQFSCAAQIITRLPAGAFYPTPKVDSAVVRLIRRIPSGVEGVDASDFFRMAHAGFSHPRKQLRNNLSSGLAIPPAQAEALLVSSGIAPQRRAETLSLAEWAELTRAAKQSTLFT